MQIVQTANEKKNVWKDYCNSYSKHFLLISAADKSIIIGGMGNVKYYVYLNVTDPLSV